MKYLKILIPSFKAKSTGKATMEHPNLETFLSQVGKDLFILIDRPMK